MAQIKAKDPKATAKAILDIEQKRKLDIAAAENRKLLFQALSEFISRRGGYLVSPVHAKRLCVEVPQFSTLPDELIDLGYDLKLGPTNTRVTAQGLTPFLSYFFAIK
jgi:hypothetical protein